MNSEKFKASPTAYKILLITCGLLALYLLFSFINSLRLSQNILLSAFQLLLWMGIGLGFYWTKKWAWASVFVIMLFSLLSLVYSLLSLRIPVNVFIFLSIALVAAILWGLNVPSLRAFFFIDTRNGKSVAPAVTNLGLFCIAIALFIVFQLLGASRVAASSIPAQLFIGLLGFVFLLLGLGIWRLNTYAFQATLPFLFFTAISVAIILIYDFFKSHRFLAVRHSLFYIVISVGLLWYWIKLVAPRLPAED